MSNPAWIIVQVEDLRARIGVAEGDSCVFITSVFHSYMPVTVHDYSI